MRFDWDEAKNETNFRKHGVYFEAAEEVFAGDVLTMNLVISPSGRCAGGWW